MKTKLLLFFIILSANLGWGQTNPTPQTLPYTQNFGTTTFTVMPTGMAAWTGGANRTTQVAAEGGIPGADATVAISTASTATGGVYGYAVSSNARAYIQQSSNTINGTNTIVTAINTGTATSINVSYQLELINGGASTQDFGLELQYRAGTSGLWTNVSGSVITFGAVTTYTTSTLNYTISGLSASTAYQIRWITWRPAGSSNSKGVGIDNISITSTASGSAPPTLTPDTTLNTVDNLLDIAFTDDATWRGAITAVKIGATTLTPTTDYTITTGNLQLKPSGLNALLTTSGTKAVAVVATGYTDATVSQVINAGAPTTNSTASINAALAVGTSRTITCTAKDQYNNLVSGYTFAYDVTITNANSTTAESYTINGTAFATTATTGNLITATNASGVATFTAVLPATIDPADGVSIQVQLANDTTNIGTAFSFTQLATQTITFGALSAVTYGDTALTLSATASSGLPVSYASSNPAVASITGNTVTFLSNGSVTITASQAGDATYNAAIAVPQSLTINQKALTVNPVAANNKTYNGTNAATITGTLIGIVGTDVVTFVGTGTFATVDAATAIAVTSTATLGGTNASKYVLTQPTALSANITQASQTISVTAVVTKTMGDADFASGATSATSGTNPLTYISSNPAVATINASGLITLVSVGTTTITVSQAASLNYASAANATIALTVKPLPIAAWDVFGQSSPATFAATTYSTLLSSTTGLSNITRGSGAISSTGGNSFRTTGFQNNGIATTNTDYFQTTITAKTGYQVSLSSIDANFAGTATFYNTGAGVSSQFAYSLDGTTFTLIASPTFLTTTPLTLPQIDLTGIAALQNVPYGTTVTFRYYASGQTLSGGWGFTSAATGTNGLAFGGTITVKDAVWESGVWTNTGLGPDATLDAVIKDTYVYPTNGAFTAKNLIVATGGKLTVNSGNTLTLADAITNNLTADKVVFENGASLLQSNSSASNFGNITYKRTTSTLVNNLDFVYWGTPVNNPTLSSMWMTATNDTFYSFDNAATPQDWSYAAPSAVMITGKGYISRAVAGTGTPTWNPTNAWTANFVGKPNNGDYTAAVYNNGTTADNLLSNPYPSALDIVLFRNDIDNKALLTGNFYFWTHNTAINANTYTDSDYAIYNVALDASVGTVPASSATPAPDRYVDASQGFFAECLMSGTVTFKNAHRATSNNSNFYRTASPVAKTENNKIWFNLFNNSGIFKQQLLAYAPEATNGYDDLYDAKSVEGNPTVDFYSINNDKKLAIQSRALPFTNKDEVKMGFKTAVTGEFIISIDHFDDLYKNKTIYLQDNLLGKDFILSNASYTFYTTAGTFDNRFVLKYISKQFSNVTNNDVVIANNNNELNIKCTTQNIKKVQVYDILGKKILENDSLDSNLYIINGLMKNQNLIIKITLIDGNEIIKKVGI